MICDRIENASRYYCMGPLFEKALRYLQDNDLSVLAPGIYEIDGKDVFLKIQSYETMEPSLCKIELHEVYADVQMILEGQEEIGYTHRVYSTPKIPYDPTIDMALVECVEIGPIVMKPGCFIVAFPQDAHQSCRISGTAGRIKKALIKVRI
ncbi:MAG: YhcH/YjgK/YiaL family protein [Clostridia bacterium]